MAARLAQGSKADSTVRPSRSKLPTLIWPRPTLKFQPASRSARAASAAGDQVALRQALSCYYSGNFATGFRHGYVRKVVVTTGTTARAVLTTQPKEQL